MLLNIFLFMTACLYWFYTGHGIPAFICFLMFITLYNDELYFVTLILSIVTIISIIFYFFFDFFVYGTISFGFGIFFMLLIYIKAKNVFNNDSFVFD